LVGILTLRVWVRNFPFSMDLAGSRHASNSKLDVRPVKVESRLSAREMMVGVRLLMERSWLSSKLQCPKGRLGLGSALWSYQRRTGGYDWIWRGMEGPPTHSGFGVFPSGPVGWHAVPYRPPVLLRFGHLWTGFFLVLPGLQRYLAVQIQTLPLKCHRPLTVSVPVGLVALLDSLFVVGCRWILPDCPSRPLPLAVPSGMIGSFGPSRQFASGVHLPLSVPRRNLGMYPLHDLWQVG
jgi:hypothetical protein